VGSRAITAIYMKRGKIGPTVLWGTNRKSHTRFRLVPKSMTLDDLERPKRALAEVVIYRAHQKNLSAAKCRSVILVSRNIRFVRVIRRGSLNRGSQMTVGWWSDLRWSDLFFEISGSKAHIIVRNSSSVFQWSQSVWPWMIPKRYSRCFVLALAPGAFASTRLPCLAYIYVPLLTYCKIRCVSKFTAVSRGSPCDSTAFLFYNIMCFSAEYYNKYPSAVEARPIM